MKFLYHDKKRQIHNMHRIVLSITCMTFWCKRVMTQLVQAHRKSAFVVHKLKGLQSQNVTVSCIIAH